MRRLRNVVLIAAIIVSTPMAAQAQASTYCSQDPVCAAATKTDSSLWELANIYTFATMIAWLLVSAI